LTPDFDRCAAWLQAALAYNGGRYGLEHIRERVADGRMQLFCGERCALVTEIADWPTGLKVCTVVLGGGDLAEIKPLSEHVTAWAASIGCNEMEVVGRPGWARALGTGQAVATVFRKPLNG
jgi:hypothetical protein